MEIKGANRERIQFKPPVFIQIAGMIFGLVFALSGNYVGWEKVCAVLGSPLTIAGMVRIIIVMYRVVANLTAQRVYSESGICIGLVPNKSISAIAAVIGFGLIISALLAIARFSQVLMIIVIVVAILLEVFVFCRDVKILFLLRKANKNS